MHNFHSRFVLLDATQSSLPFTVGGVTQHGVHMPIGNNQDAMSLLVEDLLVIAIVCDGCAGASPLGINTMSFNETGAQVLSVLVLRSLQRFHKQGLQPGAEMVTQLETELNEKYFQLVSLLAGDDPAWREHILLELLMSTVVGAVIGSERWCVFHGGDGVAIIDGKMQILDRYSGHYPANAVVLKQKGKSPGSQLFLLQEGKSADLRNLLIGSDGVQDFLNEKDSKIENITLHLDRRDVPYMSGHDVAFFREFRKRVWNPLAANRMAQGEHDDRTLLLIRRLPGPWPVHAPQPGAADFKPAILQAEAPLPDAPPSTGHEEQAFPSSAIDDEGLEKSSPGTSPVPPSENPDRRDSNDQAREPSAAVGKASQEKGEEGTEISRKLPHAPDEPS